MATEKKATAVGTLLLASLRLQETRGGKQKLQKILGKSVFRKTPDGKKWYIDTPKISKFTIKKLEELTEKIKEA
ncbi:MAG: hypothetical protein WBG71_04395 [Leeuwenhoekiella sp.]